MALMRRRAVGSVGPDKLRLPRELSVRVEVVLLRMPRHGQAVAAAATEDATTAAIRTDISNSLRWLFGRDSFVLGLEAFVG
jgi:hypothetical protein